MSIPNHKLFTLLEIKEIISTLQKKKKIKILNNFPKIHNYLSINFLYYYKIFI